MIIYYSGIEWVVSRLVGSKKVTIIMFHSVNNNRYVPAKTNFSITPSAFDEKMKFFSRYNIISMDDLIRYFDVGEDPPKNSMVLTFDDGYQDNYSNAFNILKKYNIPAIVYLTTDYIDGGGWLPLNTIYYLLTVTGGKELIINKPEINVNMTLKSRSDRENAKHLIAKIYKQADIAARMTILEAVAEALTGGDGIPETPDDLNMLSWKEINEMHSSGLIQFGSHTCSHQILSRSSSEKVTNELSESKARIEEILNTPVPHFCYPNGHSEDFTPEHKSMLRKLGYRTACTTIEGTNTINSDTDLFELKRFSWKVSNYMLAVKIMLNR